MSWLLSLLLSVSEMHTHLDSRGAMLIFMLETDVKSSVHLVNKHHSSSLSLGKGEEEYLSLWRKRWDYLLFVSGG